MKGKFTKLLAGTLLMSMALTACGTDTDTAQSGANSDNAQATAGDAASNEAAGETEHIVVTYIYPTTEPKDMDKIQDAVNEMTVPDINVEVEFKTISLSDATSNYSLWISSGETIDLMLTINQNLKNYVTSGQLEPLEQWINEDITPNLCSLMEEFPMTTSVQGEVYGLRPVEINYGTQPGVMVREDWFTETGYEEKEIYTYEDLTNIFAAIKEKHPDTYPLCALGNGITAGRTNLSFFRCVELPGLTTLAGMLPDKDSTTIENFYTSDIYKEYLEQMAQWYEDGYILPDAATTDLSQNELLVNGKVAVWLLEQTPEMFGNDGYGFEVKGLPMGEAYVGADLGSTYFSVPITAEHPEAALRFMDYMYENHDLSNLLRWGLEGVHYERIDEDNHIKYVDGKEGVNSDYYSPFGVWGDRRYELDQNPSVTRQDQEVFTQKAMSNKYQDYEFEFDSTPVSSQLLSCQSVLDQYVKALETGSLGAKWEETYNTMIAQLETAGINDIIAECQSQLDEFLKQ